MKKIIALFALFYISHSAKAQDVSVANNLFGFQLGILSASFINETRLNRKLTLHTEIGASINFYTVKSNNTDIKDKTETISLPYITVEPRYYYGLDRRSKLGKNIKNNSANYFSFATTYYATNLAISNSNSSSKVAKSLTFVPDFGIRRSFAKNFNYEFVFGVGYKYNIFDDTIVCNCKHNEVALDIQAKIGYNF